MRARAVERRIVTVLFADLVGFTSLSERLDAEDVALIQDGYVEAVQETVQRHGGLLEKFVGDAAMAVFGAPRVRDDDAERAVRAACALVAAVERLGSSLGLEPETLRLRVGVHSGEAVYGEATADRGPVTGDTVNVAARLQAAAMPGSVLVGELTALAVADAIELERVGGLELKGVSRPVPAWRVVAPYAERSRERALGALQAPLIGRETELALLLGRLGEGPRRLVVVAPPGVGKSRLLAEFGGDAARRGAVVLRARLRPDLLSPFEPVGQLLRSVGDPADVVSPLTRAGTSTARAEVVRDALAAAVAPLDALTGLLDERDRLFAAWLQGLDALSGEAPALWLVEDLHWASGDLLAFLDVAGRAPAAHGRLIVGTARPGLLESAAEWCGGAELCQLEPLSATQTVGLVQALIGDVLPAALVDRIGERSGGNALFVEELLRMWGSTGMLVQDAQGTWTLTHEAEDVVLPPTVQAIYAGQLDDLPAPARAAARRASVAGRRFPVSGLLPLGVEDAEEAVGTLVRRALISEAIDDLTLGRSHVFRHALLQDAGYASLARAERAALHARFADWLARFPADALPTLAEVIARHYGAAVASAPALTREIAGRTREDVSAVAADWFERAAETAARFAAWESARLLADRSLELTDVEQPLLRARRLQRLAGAEANTLGVEAAEDHLREALELYRGTGAGGAETRSGLAEAGAQLGGLLRTQTRFAEAEQLASTLLGEIGGPEDAATARLLLLRSVARLNAWDDYERADVDATRALELIRAEADPVLELEGLQLRAMIGSERGHHTDEAWQAVEDRARRLGRWETVASAMRNGANPYVDDEPGRVLPRIEASAEIAAAYGLVEAGAWADYLLTEAYVSAGRWDEALVAGLRAVATGEAHGYTRVIVRSWFTLLPVAHARGRDDLIRQAYPYFTVLAGREPDSHYARIVATAAHVRFAAIGLEPSFLPDVEPRLPAFELDHGLPSWLAAVETIVGAWLDAGDLAGARRALDRMRARLTHGGTALARTTEATLRSRLLVAHGDLAAAAAEAEHALAEGSTSPWWRAKAIRQLEQARAASPRLLDEAAALETQLGIRRA